MADDEFKVVTYKRNKRTRKIPHRGNISDLSINSIRLEDIREKDVYLRRVEETLRELIDSEFLKSFLSSLSGGLNLLKTDPQITNIVCLGLGKCGESYSARCQLALLIILKRIYKIDVYIYDPIFSELDCWIIEQFDCNVLKNNSAGKHKAEGQYTVFFLPHCHKELLNNLLWANWGINLQYCIIVSNSFKPLNISLTKIDCQSEFHYIDSISPYTIQLPVTNNFKYIQAFNDISIHLFPLEKLNLLPKDFWNGAEPQYKSSNLIVTEI